MARLVASKFVLLGERHDNPDHHALQTKLMRAMVAAGRRPALGFEMLATDDAPAIVRYLARSPKDAAGLGDAVNWSRSGWPEWRYYQPIAQAALDASVPIVATNLSRAATEAVRRNGLPGLGPTLATQLRLSEPTPETRLAMTRELRESHCGQVPDSTIDRMADIQWARDARIAASLAHGGQRDGAVLIAGAGHVRHDRGVPVHLELQAPGATIASVAFVEVDAAVTKAGDYAQRFGSDTLPFDYVWFTPKVDDADPCEKLKKATETETTPK
ncbi:MAG TPA: ChaN family lipoprotein [Methylomirabilota bacterium]